MYDTAHEPPARVQRLALKLPGPELAKLNVPVGVVPPVDVSVTVAVHVVDVGTITEPGLHVTLVDTGSTIVSVVRVVALAPLKNAMSSCGLVPLPG